MSQRPTWFAVLLFVALAVCHGVLFSPSLVQTGAVVAILAAILVLWRLPGSFGWWAAALGAAEPPVPCSAVERSTASWPWLLCGAGVLALAILILELQQPFYFTQDDNYATELPGVLQVCRAAVAGLLPAWNPYQLLGAPNPGLGGLIYPLDLLAYVIARFLLGNEYLTIEAYAILHLAAGYAACCWVLRGMGVRPALAAAGSLSFVLSGASLIMGRSWHAQLPVLIWAPLLAGAVQRLVRGPVGWRWAAATGLALGVFYWGGFPQYWVYGVGLCGCGLLVLLLTRMIPWTRALWLVPAFLFGLALLSPILVPQMQFTGDILRPSGYGHGVGEGLLALLLPYPVITAPHPNRWCSVYLELAGQLYYSGTLFCLANLLGLCGLLLHRPARAVVGQNPWLVCTALTLWGALGHPAGLWTLLGMLPVLGKVNNHPFRLLPFFNLAMVLGGGLVLERLLRRARRPRRWEAAAVLLVSVLLLYHVFFAKTSFYTYADRPYPPLPDELARLLADGPGGPRGRVLPIAAERSADPSYTFSLAHSLPSVYSVMSIDGYDPVTETKPEYVLVRQRLAQDPVAAARAYGVRWVLVHRSAVQIPDERFPPKLEGATALALVQAGARRLTLPDLAVFELPEPSPLAFAASAPGAALPVRFDGGGVEVGLPPGTAGGAVVVNVLTWPGMVARIDRRPVATAADEWDRLVVEVPAGAAVLQVRYVAPWQDGLRLGGVLALCAVAIALLLSLPAFRRRQEEGAAA